ncbi:MAG: hypothetical protein M8354_12065, partial [Halalkalicoccus sp.]|nr:hypothetical protein [Halalkalicoccus sp.]
ATLSQRQLYPTNNLLPKSDRETATIGELPVTLPTLRFLPKLDLRSGCMVQNKRRFDAVSKNS